MMYILELITEVINGKYENGQIFQNADMGDIYILNDELVWCDDNTPYSIVVGDYSRWEKL